MKQETNLINKKYKTPIFLNCKNSKVNIKNLKLIIGKINILSDTDKKIFLNNYNSEQAIYSSAIEGNTITNIDEFQKQKAININDIEVISIERTIELIKLVNEKRFFKNSKKITINEIKGIHQFLFKEMENSKILNSSLIGNFKNQQNYINDFLPPDPFITELEMEKFIIEYNKKETEFEIICQKAAFFHLWFEMIHPFGDGNGRIGRLLYSYYFILHDQTNELLIDPSKIINSLREDYYNILNFQNHCSLYEFLTNNSRINLEKNLQIII